MVDPVAEKVDVALRMGRVLLSLPDEEFRAHQRIWSNTTAPICLAGSGVKTMGRTATGVRALPVAQNEHVRRFVKQRLHDARA